MQSLGSEDTERNDLTNNRLEIPFTNRKKSLVASSRLQELTYAEEKYSSSDSEAEDIKISKDYLVRN